MEAEPWLWRSTSTRDGKAPWRWTSALNLFRDVRYYCRVTLPSISTDERVVCFCALLCVSRCSRCCRVTAVFVLCSRLATIVFPCKKQKNAAAAAITITTTTVVAYFAIFNVTPVNGHQSPTITTTTTTTIIYRHTTATTSSRR